ncbi:MAG: phosphohistidine phosphatase SixA [Methanoregula sp.]|nr:phosphohistidine phosphatase SixA [Methanoregula sp.]
MKILISNERVLLCMDLFILRHGKAEKSSDVTPDSARALTREGKEEVKKVALWMKVNNIRFDAIATSPLKRACETAKIVAAVLDQKDRLTVWEELAPGGDPDTICYHASEYNENATVLIIGHEPGLSMLISKIIGDTGDASITLSKAGLAKIQNYSFTRQPSGDLRWLLTPKHMRLIR